MLRLSWLISMGISLFGVMIIEHFFTLKADETGASGNLGALGIALVIPFFLLSIFTTFRYFTERARHAKDTIFRTFWLMLGVGLTAFLFYYAVQFKDEIYIQLGGSTAEPSSVIYGYPLLNEYTNKIFINFYTFGFVHALAGILGGLFEIMKPARIVEENSIHSLEDEQIRK